MFCRNCSNQLSEQAIACPKCGMNPRTGTSFCWNCGTQSQPGAMVCTSCGAGLAMPGAGQALPGAEKKILAGILGIILGSLGIHKFVLGYTVPGVIMLLGCILTCGIGGAVTGLIGLIEGIIYLTKSDEDFVQTYIIGRKEWF